MCEAQSDRAIKVEIIEEIFGCDLPPVWHPQYPYCSITLNPVKVEYEDN